MSNEAQELEEIKRRIIEKQARLFERRLDDFLSIESPDLDRTTKKEIFSSLLNEGITESVDPLTHKIINTSKEEEK